MKKAKKCAIILFALIFQFSFSQFAVAESTNSGTQNVAALFADDLNVIGVEEIIEDDGSVVYVAILENEPISYEEMLALLEPLGLNEMNHKIAAEGRSIQECLGIYLQWVISLKEELPENAYQQLYTNALASIKEASLKEGYEEMRYNTPDESEHLAHEIYIVRTLGACTNHKWPSTWKNTYSENHFRHCEVCGEVQRQNHTSAFSYNSTRYHRKYCSICQYSYGLFAHIFPAVEDFTNEVGHYYHCSSCKTSVPFDHTYNTSKWTSFSSSQHRLKCDDCSYAKVANHTFVSAVKNNIPYYECTACKYKSGL